MKQVKKIYNLKQAPVRDRTDRMNKGQNLLFNSHVRHMLKWLVKNYSINPLLLDFGERYLRYLKHIADHKGLKLALNVNKECRIKFAKLLESKTLTRKQAKEIALPKKFRALLLRNLTDRDISFILTLLYSTRRITLPIDPDISSINNAYKGSDLTDILSYLPGFIEQLKVLAERKHGKGNDIFEFPVWKEYHISTKKGPSGTQALLSCLTDLNSLPRDLFEQISSFGGPILKSRMDALYSNIYRLSKDFNQSCEDNQPIRKLSALEDSEGKTRIVAISDYWSQTCLKPVHDSFNRVLRLINQDQTFSQTEGLGSLPFDSNCTFFCYDLSSATDRFPIKIQKEFVSLLYGSSKADLWYNIMVGYPFLFKTPKGEPLRISYAVGNPMGLYSSWNTFTICHHFVLYVCCKTLNKSWFTAEYKLLGDDIVIWNKDIAERYLEIMTKVLGVDISIPKSHKSNYFVEFAKRFYYCGKEVTPFSIRALSSETKSFYSFVVLAKTYLNRGWVPVLPCDLVLHDFYQTQRLKRFKRSYLNTVHSKIKLSCALFDRLSGHVGDLELINTVLVTFNLPTFSCNQTNLAKASFRDCIHSAFESGTSSFVGDLAKRLKRLEAEYSEPLIIVDPVGIATINYSNLLRLHPFYFLVDRFVYKRFEQLIYDYTAGFDADELDSPELMEFYRSIRAVDVTSLLTERNYTVIIRAIPKLLVPLKRILNDYYKDMSYLNF